ncbi:unnamed protein product, partial [Mycobacterium sp. PO1]
AVALLGLAVLSEVQSLLSGLATLATDLDA